MHRSVNDGACDPVGGLRLWSRCPHPRRGDRMSTHTPLPPDMHGMKPVSVIHLLAGIACAMATAVAASAADRVEVSIGYLGQARLKPALSLVEQPSDNDGIAGARLAIEDKNTTGKLQKQHFTL